MTENEVPSVDLDRLERLVERFERAGASLADSEDRLARAVQVMKERDRAQAFDAWRRGQ
ncbi:hypothetical protein [Sinomonas sp. G460-2]|uniref:hypothetical protein n=1 Tax=Sinomonas sp. G460-2 TaxID=3393464 RepID=UPI0039F0D3B6